MALPIILFPYAFLSPYCSLIVPEISELRAREGDKKEKIREKTENIIHFVCLFGIGTAGLVVCYSQELGQILYAGTQAASYIHLLAPIIPIMYVDTAVDSILKGMNEQVYSMKINLLDSLLSVALVFLLMPQIGIYGYLVEIYVCEILNASLSISRLLTVVQPNMALFSSVFLPLFSIIGSTALTRLLFLACSLPLILDGYQLFLQMTVCGLLYLFFCHILQNAFSKAKKNGILYRSFIKTNCQPWKRQNLKNQEPEVKKSKN
jgi:stage V sporulation protein B